MSSSSSNPFLVTSSSNVHGRDEFIDFLVNMPISAKIIFGAFPSIAIIATLVRCTRYIYKKFYDEMVFFFFTKSLFILKTKLHTSIFSNGKQEINIDQLYSHSVQMGPSCSFAINRDKLNGRDLNAGPSRSFSINKDKFDSHNLKASPSCSFDINRDKHDGHDLKASPSCSFDTNEDKLPGPFAVVPNDQIKMATVEEFINEIAKEKPIRFSPEQLAHFTKNYAIVLGSGGNGTVYKGELPNGMLVAAKVLHKNLHERIEEQFMAEVGTMGRTYHINLVRLYGFCFDLIVTTLVYEYIENGSLDKHLFSKKHMIEWKQLLEIAIGTAKGIRYLHEECGRQIVHFDIKAANILLDANFSPKVADFGLAKLCSRDRTHLSMARGRGTPGYAAPEVWMPWQVTYKCDVYSFGMLLFEIVGRRRNFEDNKTESQEWFPKWVWTKFGNGQLQDIASCCGIEEVDRESAERMCKVALWCVQYQPEERPPMGKVVKMLEGEMEITPPTNPFHHLLDSQTSLPKKQVKPLKNMTLLS